MGTRYGVQSYLTGLKGGRYTDQVLEHRRLYEQLIELYRGFSPEESQAVNARLILLLANHIGDPGGLSEAIKLARKPSK